MQAFLRSHRWVILAAGAAIQIVAGIPAAWGVFQKSICETYGLPEQVASLLFACVIGSFGIGCVAGGFLQDKKGPRVAGVCGTVLLAGGFVAAAFVPEGQAWLMGLAFSAPVGFGCAFLYPAVMSCAQKWYADSKGLATGIIGGAVGLSGAALTLSGRWLIAGWGLRTAFCVLGAVMALVCGASCIVLENPAEQKKQQKVKKQEEYTVRSMMKTRQYWLLTASLCLAAPTIVLFSPVIVELAQQRGLSQNAGLACIVVGSVFSAAGRITMPWLSDRIGRRATDLILFAALAGLSVGFAFAQGMWVLAVYVLLTFCYSAQAAVLPSYVTDLFGIKAAGIHYGFVALGMTAGSLSFPPLAQLFAWQGARHIIAAVAAGLGLLCIFCMKQTKKGKASAQKSV